MPALRNTGRVGDEYDDFHTYDRLVDEHEAAARLGLAVATLRRWRWAGRGPGFIKVGAAVRYDPATLAAFIEAGCRTSTSDAASRSA